MVSRADEVLLASDNDREGEAIAFHIRNAILKKFPGKTIRRIVFNEITPDAIRESVRHPREVEENKVCAQKGRRVLDRLVGYKLSPFLWKKVHPGLSAGRVQSVTVRMIVDRENEIRAFVPEAQRFLEDLFTDNSEVRAWLDGLNLDIGKMADSAVAFFQDGAGNVINSTVSAIGSFVSGMATFVIAFVFACYVLLQKEKLSKQVKKVLYAFLSEKRVEWILEVCSLTAKSFSSFFAGQCVEAVILGTMFFITMSILNMPYALLVGILIAFTALIPIFGAFIGCVIGTFLILMVEIMFLILQQIEGNLIYPKVVGSSVGLPSIWVLAAVTVGGSLMGVVGMLIFIPIVSVIYTLFRASVYKRLKKKFQREKEQGESSPSDKEAAAEQINPLK